MADNTTQPPPPEPQGPSKNELKKRQKDEEKARKKAEREAKEAEQRAAKEAADVDFASQFYGKLPLNQSQERTGRQRISVASLTPEQAGDVVFFRARVNTSRAQGNKMVFLNLRQRINSIQALVMMKEGKVSKQMVKWAASVPDEAIVLVEGSVQVPSEEIKSATVKNVEILVQQIHLVAAPEGRLAFTMEDASRPEGEFEKEDAQFSRVQLDTRLENRMLDLRTRANQAIFTISSSVGEFFSEYLRSHGFVEIHTPKLQGAATESGASVFKVSYFKGDAFLAQSPQLHKQMCIAADFERVFEIGPVFRAENAFTHRHMTEFIGLDLEMAFEEHYHEVMDLIDGMLKNIFSGLKTRCGKEIAEIQKQFPCEEFKWREGPEGTLKMSFKEAVELLIADGVDPAELDDIGTTNEKRLGGIIKAKYDIDYYIIDKFPLALRPFYTMPDPADPTLSNSYDFFMRGEEILSGAQRIHEPALLVQRMKEFGIEPSSMQAYVDAFRLGCPPHAGGGIGLERVVMLFLKLGNIRRASLFPRDPKRLEP